MKEIAVLLAEGFEEAEVIIFVDFFRRLNQKVEMLACGQEGLEVISYHEILLRADAKLSLRKKRLYDAIMLPGGPQGSRKLGRDEMTVEFIKLHMDSQRLVCPFCSAGAHVMAANGLLGSVRYTCSGNNHLLYEDGIFKDEEIVKSGTIISGKGLGVSFQFAKAVADALGLEAAAEEQLNHIYYIAGCNGSHNAKGTP